MKGITAAMALAWLATGVADAHDRPARTDAVLPHAQTDAEGEAPYLQNDKLFLWRLHWINHTEIQAGDMAETQSSTEGVTGFAAALVQDHQQLETRLARLADQKRIELQLTSDEYRAVRDPLARKMTSAMDLGHLSGAEFDRRFLAQTADAHLAAIDLMRSYRGKTNDDDIRAFIDENLPAVQEHHRVAEALLASTRSDRQNVRGTEPADKEKKAKKSKKGKSGSTVEEKRDDDEPEDGTDKQEQVEEDIGDKLEPVQDDPLEEIEPF